MFNLFLQVLRFYYPLYYFLGELIKLSLLGMLVDHNLSFDFTGSYPRNKLVETFGLHLK